MTYSLLQDYIYAPLLEASREKKSRIHPHRGFINDGEKIPEAHWRTSTHTYTYTQNIIEMMPGQVANYCPGISRSAIVKSSTSLAKVRQIIRPHYGFQTSSSHLCDFDSIRLEPDKRPKDLFIYLCLHR